MSCGGSVAKWVHAGHEVVNLLMFPKVKHLKFLEMASSHLGHKTILFPGKRDTVINHETISKVESLVGVGAFDRIITHWKEDWHQDHRACHELGNILARKQPAELWYMSSHPYHLKYSEFSPEMYVNTSDFNHLKSRSISEYYNIPDHWKHGVSAHDSWRGSFIEQPYAEVFKIGNMTE